MKKWLFRILWVPVFVIASLFLVANRQMVSISLDPFSANEPTITTVALPLWSWLIFMLLIGFAMGAVGMWFSGGPKRSAARENRRLIKELRAEVTSLKAQLPREEPAPAPVDAPRLESQLLDDEGNAKKPLETGSV